MASRPRISKPYKDGRNFSDSKFNKSESKRDHSFNPKAKENRKPRSFSDNNSESDSFAPRGGQQKFRGDRSAGPSNFARNNRSFGEGKPGNFNRNRSRDGEARENRFNENDSNRGEFNRNENRFGGPRNQKPNRYGDKKPFRGNREFNQDGNNERPSYNRDDRGGERSYDRSKRFGDKKPFRGNREFNQDGNNERPSYNRDDRGGERSYDRSKRFGDKKPFRGNREFNQDGNNERSSYNRDDRGGERSFDRSKRFGDKKPFRGNREFENDGSGERSSFNRGRGAGYGSTRKFDKPRGKDFSKPKKRIAEETDGLIRLNKYISNSGICSRREADKLIEDGLISVNGTVVTELGMRVALADDVRYGGERINPERPVYILLNKPKDVITSTKDPEGRLTVIDIVKKACKERVYPVGRLDRNTTGVLLLTNDGAMAKKLTHPSSNITKMYHVVADKAIQAEHIEQLLKGVELEDGFMKVDAIDYVEGVDNKREVGLEIHSGKNRIVRRMFEHLGYEVEKLDRVIFAGLTKKNLPRGRYRFLDEKEIGMLKMLRTGK